MGESLFKFVRVRDNNRVYGWVFDAKMSKQAETVEVYGLKSGPIQVKCSSPLPEWVKARIKDEAPEIENNILADAQGYFEFTLNPAQVENFAQLSFRHLRTGEEIPGSPLVVYQDNVPIKRPPSARYFQIDDGKLQNLTYNDLIALVRYRQQMDQKVIFQPPFISWNIPLFQRPQHMALALARAGALFIYFSNGVDDLQREIVFDGENTIIVSDPQYFEPFLKDAHGAFCLCYSTMPAERILEVTKNDHLIIYEYVDHIDPKISSTWVDGCMNNWKTLSDFNTHAVITTAQKLYDEMITRFNPRRVELNPNGVSCSHFQVERDMASIPYNYRQIIKKGRPIVGYYGAIAPWLDYDMIGALARECPDMDFVFIGPLYMVDESDLPKADNLHWYGTVYYGDLPHFSAWFDVSIIPFENGEIAETTSPLKLFEYFSIGRPVCVTSWMKECVQFPIVRHGRSAGELAEQIRSSLKDWDLELEEQSKALAEEHDWNHRAESYLAFLEQLDNEDFISGEPVALGNTAFEIENDKFQGPVSINIDAGNNVIRFQLGDGILERETSVGAVLSLPLPNSQEGVFVLGFSFRGVILEGSSVLEISSDKETLQYEGRPVFENKRFQIASSDGKISFRLIAQKMHNPNSAGTRLVISDLVLLPKEAPTYSNLVPVARNETDKILLEPALHDLSLLGRTVVSVRNGCWGDNPDPVRTEVTEVPISLKMENETPNTQDFSEILIEPPSTTVSGAKAMRIKLAAPHYNPRSMGQLYYYVAVDEEVIYSEDLSAFSGLNELYLPCTGMVQVGIVVANNESGWKWGDNACLNLFGLDAVMQDVPDSLPSTSSPEGVVYQTPVPLADFLKTLS